MDGGARFPFAFGWYGSELPGYRACDDTYCFFAYDDLPPLSIPSETLDWLGPLDEATDQQMRPHRDRSKAPGQLPEIEATAGRLGLSLPAPFLRLMASPELQDRLPSGTACYFELGKAIVPYPGSQDGFILRFLNDQQNVLTWYLYLTRDGASTVIVTPYWLENLAGDPGDEAPGATMTATMGEGPDAPTWEVKSGPRYNETADPQAIQRVVANTYVCGPSFVSFLYRYWLENVLFFKLDDPGNAQLTEEERRYLAHYRDRAPAPDQADPGAPAPVALSPAAEPVAPPISSASSSAPAANNSPPPAPASIAELPASADGENRQNLAPAPTERKGSGAMMRALAGISIPLGIVLAALGAIPTGWLGVLNGLGGNNHIRADVVAGAGVALLLLGLVALVRQRRTAS
ncbi:MAG TPA: hypothetical protein VIG30_00050 [Ktedonobacterales bacterium]|jgi:hypothetical protein